MCGRYTVTKDLAALTKRFGLAEAQARLRPRYNLAPGQDAPVIVMKAKPELEMMRWGLVPAWAKDPKLGSRLINARAETLAEKPSFKHSLSRRRCLIPADGFYEWPKGKAKDRHPFLFRLKGGELFAFAGLWDIWRMPGGESLRSFSIVTTESNARVREIHDRMPVILRREDEERWLDPSYTEPKLLLPLLTPYPSDRMESSEVSMRVNSPKNDDPTLLDFEPTLPLR